MNLTLLQPGQIAQIKAIKTDQGLEQHLQGFVFQLSRETEQIDLQEFSYKGTVA